MPKFTIAFDITGQIEIEAESEREAEQAFMLLSKAEVAEQGELTADAPVLGTEDRYAKYRAHVNATLAEFAKSGGSNG